MAKRNQGAELADWLERVVVLTGTGEIDTYSPHPVYVAVVHDGSGFNPGAAIAVGQGSTRDLTDEVMEEAFDLLTREVMKNEELVREMQAEYGEDWEAVLIEVFDSRVWVFDDPNDAAMAIGTSDRARDLISLAE